jgi:hypothetical protein
MAKILDRVPYHNTPGSVAVLGEQLAVLPHQIIVWVSVSLFGATAIEEETPRIPVIFDTGSTFGFSIAERLLVRWCGLQPALLRVVGSVILNGRRLNRHAAKVWLHRNRRGKRDSFPPRPAWPLELRDGIVIYPESPPTPAPRLPLLGLRAITENGLRCTIHGKSRTLSMSS